MMQRDGSYIEKIAKIERVSLGYEDHGIFTVWLFLSYGSTAQGAGGYALDSWDEALHRRVGTAYGMEFIIRTMKACGVTEWDQIKGRTILALFKSEPMLGSGPPVGIAPLPTESGEAFIFADLRTEDFADAVA